MKPNDTYGYVEKNAISPDWMSLIKCYQPIITMSGLVLYQYLWAHYDNGCGKYRFSQILNQIDFGQQATQSLEQAFDVLSAMELLDIYQDESGYQLLLREPLSCSAFLQKSLYQKLLVKKIGEANVELLKGQVPIKTKVSKQFSDVFDSKGQANIAPSVKEGFDIEAFQTMMTRDQLRYQNETDDILALHHLAEKSGLPWLELYRIAKKTAHEKVIQPKRMQQEIQKGVQGSEQLTRQEQAIVQESRSKTALEFLVFLKETRKATVTSSERTFIKNLVELGLLDEVINVLVLYTFNKVDSANLNEKYAIKLANDFSYKDIHSAEAAILYLRDNQVGKKTQTKRTVATVTNNVPDWSKQEVNTEQTAEGQAQLADLYRQFEEMENKGGGL
ncbi:TPA: DnaD domain protein [Streptococcus suis]